MSYNQLEGRFNKFFEGTSSQLKIESTSTIIDTPGEYTELQWTAYLGVSC